jgi:HEAT repeat protein
MSGDQAPQRRLVEEFCLGDGEAAARRLGELSDQDLQALVDRLPEDMYTVRAIVAVGPRAVAPLLAAIEARGLDWEKGYALMALGDPRAIPVFLGELRSPDGRNRELAAMALGEMGATEQIPLLRALLDDVDPAVADEAAGSLARLGDIESVERIAMVARKGGKETVAAIHGLALLDHPAAHHQLMELLSRPEIEVRLAAIEALGRAGYRPAVPRLLEMMDRADELELDELLRALANLPDAASVPRLRQIVETRLGRVEVGYPTFAELAEAALQAIEKNRPL